MKRNLLTAVAVTVTAFLVGASVAQAVSVEWGGQLRPRFEYNEQAGFNGAVVPNSGTRTGDYFVSSRIRLHAKADILPDTSAFIQLQSVRNWGNDLSNLGGNQASIVGAGPGGGGSSGGSGNAAFAPSDNDDSIGVHQAYFTLKNFATLPVDLKIGRQEVVLDGHRILGNTGWTQGAQTHDAARLTHSNGNHTLSYIYSLANEGARATGPTANGAPAGVIGAAGAPLAADANDARDEEVHVAYANFQGILGGGLSLYFVALDDDFTGGQSTVTILDNNLYTVGVRQAGQIIGLDYRGEFYYQFGDAEGSAVGANGTAGVGAPFGAVGLKDTDRSAYMFGARLGKKFNNVMWKPSITLWYDYLSGTSDDDARDGDFNTFNTLFDTGHKFYGFMDLFLPATGANTNFLGLVDYAVKTSIQPAKGWTLKADWHYFTTAESVQANTNFSGSTVGVAGSGDGGDDNSLGSEMDLTLVHKYNANTTISAGYSKFWQESSFELLNGTASSTNTVTPASWAYLMFDVKF